MAMASYGPGSRISAMQWCVGGTWDKSRGPNKKACLTYRQEGLLQSFRVIYACQFDTMSRVFYLPRSGKVMQNCRSKKKSELWFLVHGSLMFWVVLNF